jgi:hypothetical protein
MNFINPSLSISNTPTYKVMATCLELYDFRGPYVLRLGWLSEVGLSTIVPFPCNGITPCILENWLHPFGRTGKLGLRHHVKTSKSATQRFLSGLALNADNPCPSLSVTLHFGIYPITTIGSLPIMWWRVWVGPIRCMWLIVAWWLRRVRFLRALGVGGRLNKTQLRNL